MGRFFLTVCVFIVTTSASLNDIRVVPTANVDIVDHPRYAFNYAVSDLMTRDKAQWETRDGDVVKGSYSVAEPDGSLRVFDYSADPHNSFNALVKNLGPSIQGSPIVTIVTPFVNPRHKTKITAPFAPTMSPTLSVVPQTAASITDIVPNNLVMPLQHKTADPLIPLVGPLSYGFGGAPIIVGYPSAPSLERQSLPWDPLTRSYGGWRPTPGHSVESKPHLNVYRTQYKNGILHKWENGPIPFSTLVIQNKY